MKSIDTPLDLLESRLEDFKRELAYNNSKANHLFNELSDLEKRSDETKSWILQLENSINTLKGVKTAEELPENAPNLEEN